MRYVNALFVSTAIFLFASCSSKSDTYRQLVQVDSMLLGHNNEDSALSILRNIEPRTKDDSAYYNILKVAANYRRKKPANNFKGINASINYYTDNYDARKLAYAYYYKTTILIELDSAVTEMIPLLKHAEKYAEKTTDYRLLDRIYSGLTYANARMGELEEALNSARKELFYAKKTNDNFCIAYALSNLSILHKYVSPTTDSSAFYIQQCQVLANEVEDRDKPLIYNYIGESLLNEDPAAAKQYFIDAVKHYKLTDAYLNLAKLYYAGNEFDIALKYCDSALIAPSLQSKKETYMLMAEHYYKNKNIEQYRKAIDEMIETQAKISQETENRRMLELQRKFDYEKQKAEYDRKKLMLINIISLMAVLFVLLALFHLLKLQKIRERDLELESRNTQLYKDLMAMSANEEQYKKQITELETENQNLSSQKSDLSRIIANNKTRITILQGKVEKLNTQKYEYIESGKMIYHKMEQNQPITMFDDKWANCIYYFSFNMSGSMFEGYNNLTVSDKVWRIGQIAGYFFKVFIYRSNCRLIIRG